MCRWTDLRNSHLAITPLRSNTSASTSRTFLTSLPSCEYTLLQSVVPRRLEIRQKQFDWDEKHSQWLELSFRNLQRRRKKSKRKCGSDLRSISKLSRQVSLFLSHRVRAIFFFVNLTLYRHAVARSFFPQHRSSSSRLSIDSRCSCSSDLLRSNRPPRCSFLAFARSLRPTWTRRQRRIHADSTRHSRTEQVSRTL